MATRTISTSLVLDGEKEFKRQLSEVNRELSNLGAEMKYNEEVFKGQANTTDALRAKSELLRKEYDQQTEKVKALERAVKESAEAFGETDSRTDKWRQSLTRAQTDLVKLQRELGDTERYLKEAEDSIDDCATSIDEFGRDASDVRSPLGDFTDTLSKFKNMLVGGAIVNGLKEAGEAILDLEESTREYRSIMGSLEVSSQQAGYSAEETAEAYMRLYGALGDSQATATTLANLQAVGLEQKDLLTLIDQTVGAWGRYGDSIPIDGLAEAINETIRAGEVTGVFADVLNWGSQENENFGVTMRESTKENEEWNKSVEDAKTAEDYFNLALQECQTESERTDLVLKTLSEQGLAEAGQAWRDVNDDVVEANESQARMEEAMGRLGEAIAPAANAIRNVGAGAIEYFADVVDSATTLVQNFLKWWDKFLIADKSEVEKRRAEARGYTTTKTYGSGPTDNSAWASRTGYATGLSYVPYNGFPVELHEGEGVLTKEENRTWALLNQRGLMQSAETVSAQLADADPQPQEITIVVQSILDRKVVGESVTKYQNEQRRAANR